MCEASEEECFQNTFDFHYQTSLRAAFSFFTFTGRRNAKDILVVGQDAGSKPPDLAHRDTQSAQSKQLTVQSFQLTEVKQSEWPQSSAGCCGELHIHIYIILYIHIFQHVYIHYIYIYTDYIHMFVDKIDVILQFPYTCLLSFFMGPPSNLRPYG